MRKITLTQFTFPDHRSVRSIDRKFQVYLGNGSSYAFNSKVQAQKFLVDASEVLTMKLIQVNEMLIDARVLYQLNWFFLDCNKEVDKKLRDNFSILDSSMLFLANLSEKDSNHWAFQKFRIVLDNLELTLAALVELMEKKSNTYQIKKNQIDIERIYEIRYFLDDFWKDHPARIPKGGFNVPPGYQLKHQVEY